MTYSLVEAMKAQVRREREAAAAATAARLGIKERAYDYRGRYV